MRRKQEENETSSFIYFIKTTSCTSFSLPHDHDEEELYDVNDVKDDHEGYADTDDLRTKNSNSGTNRSVTASSASRLTRLNLTPGKTFTSSHNNFIIT